MRRHIKYILPLLSVLVLVGLYGILESSLIKCRNCGLGDDYGRSLYQVDANVADLRNVNDAVNARKAEIDKKANSNSTIAATPAATVSAPETKQSPANANTAKSLPAKPGERDAGTAAVASSNSNAAPKPAPSPTASPKPLTEKEKAEQEIRATASSRYAFRIYWIFLSGILFFLSLASLVAAAYIITSLPIKKGWLIPPYASAAGVVIVLWFRDWDYMSILLPLFEETFLKDGISLFWTHAFNVGGFAATACLAVTSAILYWQVGEDAGQTDAEIEKENRLAKIIFYIGAAMLFVAMLRMRLAFDWHMTYVVWYLQAGLSAFFSSIIAVQAAFYTLMLGIMYLPFTLIRKKEQKQGVAKTKAKAQTAEADKASVSAKAWGFIDSLPKLIALIGPFLAGPIAELVKFFTTG